MLKTGVLYFALVFGAGFALGAIRIFAVAPRVGVRTAELLEAPVMLVVSAVAARWIVRRFAVPSTPRDCLGIVTPGAPFTVMPLLMEREKD